MTTELDVTPSSFQIGSGETPPLAFDFANYLAVGQTVASATATLTNRQTGASYTAGLGTLSNTTTTVTQPVTTLAAGYDYDLIVTVTLSDGTKRQARLRLVTVF